MLPLDPRLRLSHCDVPVEYQINSPVTSASSATVKVSCSGAVHWTLYAPAQIAVFGETAVASHSLERGSLIQAGDFHFVRQNLNQIGANYVDPKAAIIGQELKRSLREGEPLRLSHLELPKIVQRGDRVTLEAQALGLNVAAPGLAMANGKVGSGFRLRMHSPIKLLMPWSSRPAECASDTNKGKGARPVLGTKILTIAPKGSVKRADNPMNLHEYAAAI